MPTRWHLEWCCGYHVRETSRASHGLRVDDFLFIDVQHAIYSLETIGHIAQTALGCGVAPLVRVRSCRDPDISVMLDCGVTGIVCPDVNTPDDARQIVQTCKFAPIGRRSVTSGYPFFDYRPVPQQEAISLLNANTLVVCMIESLEGLANCEAIAAVDGVDVPACRPD